ncbi:hypothetical protein D3C86_2058200 [compost metagenome]
MATETKNTDFLVMNVIRRRPQSNSGRQARIAPKAMESNLVSERWYSSSVLTMPGSL